MSEHVKWGALGRRLVLLLLLWRIEVKWTCLLLLTATHVEARVHLWLLLAIPWHGCAESLVAHSASLHRLVILVGHAHLRLVVHLLLLLLHHLLLHRVLLLGIGSQSRREHRVRLEFWLLRLSRLLLLTAHK